MSVSTAIKAVYPCFAPLLVSCFVTICIMHLIAWCSLFTGRSVILVRLVGTDDPSIGRVHFTFMINIGWCGTHRTASSMFTVSLWVYKARQNGMEKQYRPIGFVENPETYRIQCSSSGITTNASKHGFEVSLLACCDALEIADVHRLVLTIEKADEVRQVPQLDTVLHGLNMHSKAALEEEILHSIPRQYRWSVSRMTAFVITNIIVYKSLCTLSLLPYLSSIVVF